MSQCDEQIWTVHLVGIFFYCCPGMKYEFHTTFVKEIWPLMIWPYGSKTDILKFYFFANIFIPIYDLFDTLKNKGLHNFVSWRVEIISLQKSGIFFQWSLCKYPLSTFHPSISIFNPFPTVHYVFKLLLISKFSWNGTKGALWWVPFQAPIEYFVTTRWHDRMKVTKTKKRNQVEKKRVHEPHKK